MARAASQTAATVIRPQPQQALSSAEAAYFVGLGETFFRSLVAQGKMPRPRVIGSRKLWDVDELAASFKALPKDGESQSGSWDDWERA